MTPTLTIRLQVDDDPDEVAQARQEMTHFFHERGLEPEVKQRGNRLQFRLLIARGFTQRDAQVLGEAFRRAFLEG